MPVSAITSGKPRPSPVAIPMRPLVISLSSTLEVEDERGLRVDACYHLLMWAFLLNKARITDRLWKRNACIIETGEIGWENNATVMARF